MPRFFRKDRVEIERTDLGEIPRSASRPHAVICSVTYLSRPQNLPPFFNAAESLTRSGYQVHGFGTTGKIGNKPFEEISPGFTFTRVNVRTREFFYRMPEWLVENKPSAVLQYVASFLEYNFKIFRKARRCRADIVEAHDLPALLIARIIAKRLKVPLVYHAHELWSEMDSRYAFAGFWRRLEKRLIRDAALVVVPEENRARILRDEYGARKLPLVVANCPPFREPHASTTLAEMYRGRGVEPRCIVLYQGVISSDRCVDEIVGAAAKFTDGVALTLIGQGFEEWINPESRIPPGGRIMYLPHVPYDKLLGYTASADIGLLFYRNTCRNNYFCAPNKLYEYMMMGLPVITCNYPGLVPFVEGQGIGLCVDPQDPGAIADAVNRIAGDPALRARMRENGLRLARERWNWEQEFERLHGAYASLPSRAVTREGAVSPVRAVA